MESQNSFTFFAALLFRGLRPVSFPLRLQAGHDGVQRLVDLAQAALSFLVLLVLATGRAVQRAVHRIVTIFGFRAALRPLIAAAAAIAVAVVVHHHHGQVRVRRGGRLLLLMILVLLLRVHRGHRIIEIRMWRR